jgi:arylsulfatase A-like enzyme
MGNPHLKTPNIDRLGRGRALFRNHFCTTSLCSPSRASILGGLYAHSHGVVNNFTDYPRRPADVSAPVAGGRLRDRLHRQVAHGRGDDSKRPGFDHFVTHKGQGKYFDNDLPVPTTASAKLVPGYYTTVVTDMAIEWMKERDKKERSRSC